jgi:hypothetical protein
VVNTSPRGADTQRPFIIKDIFPMSVENLTFVSEGKEILRGITFHLDSNGRTFIVEFPASTLSRIIATDRGKECLG